MLHGPEAGRHRGCSASQKDVQYLLNALLDLDEIWPLLRLKAPALQRGHELNEWHKVTTHIHHQRKHLSWRVITGFGQAAAVTNQRHDLMSGQALVRLLAVRQYFPACHTEAPHVALIIAFEGIE